MKFGKVLHSSWTPEWRSQYLDYDGLKEILEKIQLLKYGSSKPSITTSPDVDESKSIETEVNHLDAQFFAGIHRDLEKVGLFYDKQLSEAKSTYHNLYHDEETNKTVQVTLTAAAKAIQLKWTEFYLSLILLQNYQDLNYTGFRKILKKRDKNLSNRDGYILMSTLVENSKFHQDTQLAHLIAQTEDHFIRLRGGDRHDAMKRLRVLPLPESSMKATTFRFGLFLGASLILLLISIRGICLTDNVRGEGRRDFGVGLQMYRGWLIFIFNLFLVSVNVKGWKRAGVNHILIFQIDPRHHLCSEGIGELASQLLLYWSIFVVGYLHSDSLGLPPLIFPFFFNVTILLWLFNPLNIASRSSRYWFIRRLFRCFVPIFDVQFADFWLMDQLNSLVICLMDLHLTICHYSTQVNYSDWSIQETAVGICGENQWGIRPLVALIPALLRFIQCIKRAIQASKNSSRRRRHLTNAGKYSTAFVVVIFCTLTKEFRQYPTIYETLTAFWILSYVISYGYTLAWDVIMDWGLMDRRYAFLREELIYDKKWIYWTGIICDVVLRLSWLGILCTVLDWSRHLSGASLFIVALLECIRRFIWNFFRLENEHLNNCGEFRAVRNINIEKVQSRMGLIQNGTSNSLTYNYGNKDCVQGQCNVHLSVDNFLSPHSSSSVSRTGAGYSQDSLQNCNSSNNTLDGIHFITGRLRAFSLASASSAAILFDDIIA